IIVRCIFSNSFIRSGDCTEYLDSRLVLSDGVVVSVFSGKYPQDEIRLFSQKQKTKDSTLKFVIPAQAGIWFVRFRLF
ncbi:hypothetical protein, partial [Neisseria meningitidis]|uniref:hypothetical protein n=1 Tax=Neisseria meningitidis TaxID=487 RepID=UPI001BA6133F